MVTLNSSSSVGGRRRGRSSRGGAGAPAPLSPSKVGGSRRRRGRSSRGGAGAPAPLSPSKVGGSRRRQRKQRKSTRRTYRGG